MRVGADIIRQTFQISQKYLSIFLTVSQSRKGKRKSLLKLCQVVESSVFSHIKNVSYSSGFEDPS